MSLDFGIFLCYNIPKLDHHPSLGNYMDNKTKEALKQLQTEIRQLQTVVAGKKPEVHAGEEESAPRREKGSKETIVQCEVQHFVPGTGVEVKRLTVMTTSAQLARVTNETAAALGYALASPQKIALLRALIASESESASALGEVTGLTTGSLYHHLRELMRADLVLQLGRNSYVLTERGVRVLLIMLTLAGDER
jgi:DNA-binding transcriptional ArsR family regulator